MIDFLEKEMFCENIIKVLFAQRRGKMQ